MHETTQTLTAIAYGEVSVLEALAGMSLDTHKHSGLDEKAYLMVRVAALVAMDAPPVCYAMNLDAAVDTLELAELLGILMALAPVVGSARVASAASNFLEIFRVDDYCPEIDQAPGDTDEPASTWAYDRPSELAAKQNPHARAYEDKLELEAV
jgi:4-carboxymuconolactone decarboxylase